jgi:hypothetical protein
LKTLILAVGVISSASCWADSIFPFVPYPSVQARLQVPRGDTGGSVYAEDMYNETFNVVVTSEPGWYVPLGTPDVLHFQIDILGYPDISINSGTETIGGQAFLQINDQTAYCPSTPCGRLQTLAIPFVYGQPVTLHFTAEARIGYSYRFAPGNPMPQTLAGATLGNNFGDVGSWARLVNIYAGRDCCTTITDARYVNVANLPEPATALPILLSLTAGAIWQRRRQSSRS